MFILVRAQLDPDNFLDKRERETIYFFISISYRRLLINWIRDNASKHSR